MCPILLCHLVLTRMKSFGTMPSICTNNISKTNKLRKPLKYHILAWGTFLPGQTASFKRTQNLKLNWLQMLTKTVWKAAIKIKPVK